MFWRFPESFLLSHINTLPLPVPPPSDSRISPAGQWAVAELRTFAPGQPRTTRCCSSSPDWKLGSPELFTPDEVWFLSAHFVGSERYFLRRSPQLFPLLPVFYSPLSTAYCAVSIVILPDGTMSYATTVYRATQMLRKTYSALHSPRPKHFSAHKYFALWQNSKLINEVSDTEL